MSDRVKPHSPEAERRVLGCMMLKIDSLIEIQSEFPTAEELFYDFRHRAIYEVMRDLNSNDPIEIHDLLKSRKIDAGGIAYVAALANEAATGLTEETNHYAAILARDYVRRRLIETAAEIDRSGYESEDAADALANAERSIMEIGASMQSDADPVMKILCRQVLDEMESALRNQGIIRGLSLGFHDLDWMTHGLKPGQVVVLGARPGVGKTSLAMNVVENVAVDQKFPTGVFSLEMTALELIHRMACSRSRIDSNRAQSGEFQERDFTNLSGNISKISSAPIHICEKGGLTIYQLSARARRMHQRHKLKLIVIDYLQLMQSRIKGNRNEQLTEISNGVKALAKDLKVPIVLLSQLSRDVEKSEREPRMSDLRDSGSIEQDADIIILLSPKPIEEKASVQVVEALIPKHRGGPVGKIKLVFTPALTRFESCARTPITADIETPTHWQEKG